jgi:hypothetical protein
MSRNHSNISRRVIPDISRSSFLRTNSGGCSRIFVTESQETLLAYNIQDVVSLEALMTIAFNKKLKDTPFEHIRRLSHPSPPPIPFKADLKTISKIKKQFSYF